MSQPIRRLVLIDGHAQVFRAYHAIKEPLTTRMGESTQAVYAFLTMLLRLRRQVSLDHVMVVFDPEGPSFRHDQFPAYKATRTAPPPDLFTQLGRIRQLLEALQMRAVSVDGFEADDVLATLALKAVAAGGEALICSVDKDVLQVVRPGIRVWREHLGKADELDEAGVFAKLGVRPDQVPDYLALIGDSSDNLPGVPGVGPKTAVALLSEHGTFDAIIAAADSMGKKKIAENLKTHGPTARKTLELVRLRFDVAIDFDWESARWELRPNEALLRLLEELEFGRLLYELGLTGGTAPTPRPAPPPSPPANPQLDFLPETAPAPAPVAPESVEYQTIRTAAELRTVCEAIQAAGVCAIDTETSDLDTRTADLVGVSLSWAPGRAAYIPLLGGGGGPFLDLEVVRGALSPLLADSRIRWIAHHWNFDFKILRAAGFAAPEVVHADTMLAAYLTNPDRIGVGHGLKALAMECLGEKMTEIQELIGDGNDMLSMASVDTEAASRYASRDADMTLRLWNYFEPRLQQTGVEKVFREIELPLVPVLAGMEIEGVRIDPAHFSRLSRQAEAELQRLQREIHGLAGHAFNISSPKQVAAVLFEEIGLKSDLARKGKSGVLSTDVEVLEDLSRQHPLPARLLEYRQAEKLKNTYLDALPRLIHPRTGRLHTSYNQTVAATGRLSSSDPNLQNIPIRTEAGRLIREGFVPRADDWCLVAADYSQIELRILAHLSGDEALTEAFRTGADIHTQTAARVFGVPQDAVTKTMRSQAKAINFGIIYGMSAFRLAKDLEIDQGEARRFIDEYFRAYSGVHRFLEQTKEEARRLGYVRTISGRRRLLPDINSPRVNQRQAAERVALNTPIQGTCADMIKMAMIRVAARIRREGLRARMILQVHDELVFDAPQSEAEVVTRIAREEMVGALDLNVPIVVDVASGPNWAACK